MEKFKPHKNCSCLSCRKERGKDQKNLRHLERAYRHREKMRLKKDLFEFENQPTGGNYFS